MEELIHGSSRRPFDFDAVYAGRPGFPVPGFTDVPWGIGRPQPALAGLEFFGDVGDIGCGFGDNAAHIAAHGHDVVGLDISRAAVSEARRRFPTDSVRFEVADATHLQDWSNSFDTLLDCSLFHCLDPAARPRYAEQLLVAAKPHATLHVLCFADFRLDGLPAPLPVGAAELSSVLRATGWTVHEVEPDRIVARGAAMQEFITREGGLVQELTPLPAWRLRATVGRPSWGP